MSYKMVDKATFKAIPHINKSKVDSIHLRWYSRFLFAMNEPLLYNRQFNKTIFRFTWLRTFHHPIIVRIEKELNSVFLYWKVSDGAGGYDPGSLIINNKLQIGVSEWTKFISKIDSGNFWKMQRSGSIGTDGSEWILEGCDSTKYYVTSFWSPGHQSEIFKICYYLIELTKMKLNEEDIY